MSSNCPAGEHLGVCPENVLTAFAKEYPLGFGPAVKEARGCEHNTVSPLIPDSSVLNEAHSSLGDEHTHIT